LSYAGISGKNNYMIYVCGCQQVQARNKWQLGV